MDEKLIGRVLEAYGLKPDTIKPAERGYRNQSFACRLADGSWRNLILYKREPDILKRIKNANYVGDFLAGLGMPARRTADPRIVKLSGSGTTYGALYYYLPGKTIPWEAYTMAHLKTLGRTMATMHKNLAALERSNLSLAAEELLSFAVRMEDYFASPNVKSALTSKLNIVTLADLKIYKAMLMGLTEAQGQQALHLDLVRGNILFSSKQEISGILDFEKAAWGPPVVDIARTLAFLIVDCKYKPAAKVRKYFLESGYMKYGLGRPSLSGLNELINFYLLHDFYKFLRHNPYEFLPANEHFIRTRSQLLKRGLIKNT